MNDTICKNCQFYVQHYGLFEGKLRPVYCGHCKCRRGKGKRPDAKSCERFAPAEPLSDQYVSRQFLTTQLLQKFLDTELLPDEVRQWFHIAP